MCTTDNTSNTMPGNRKGGRRKRERERERERRVGPKNACAHVLFCQRVCECAREVRVQKFKSVRAGGGCDVAGEEVFGVEDGREKRERVSVSESERERERGRGSRDRLQMCCCMCRAG